MAVHRTSTFPTVQLDVGHLHVSRKPNVIVRNIHVQYGIKFDFAAPSPSPQPEPAAQHPLYLQCVYSKRKYKITNKCSDFHCHKQNITLVDGYIWLHSKIQ